MPSEITDFFDDYIASFDRLNPASIAAHYCEQSVVVDANGRHHFDSRPEAAKKLSNYCDGFEQMGYSGARYVCDFYQSLGKEACFVDVSWSIALRDSELNYKTAYTLHKWQSSWKIGSAMVYDY